MATITIRDFATTVGGGHAVVHVEGCDHLRRTAVEVQAMSDPDIWVSDEQSYDVNGWLDPRHVAAAYARKFTVDFPVHFCSCTEWAINRLETLQAARACEDDD